MAHTRRKILLSSGIGYKRKGRGCRAVGQLCSGGYIWYSIYRAPTGAGGLAMRIGLGKKKSLSSRATGFALIAVGAIIIFLAMPVIVYVILGGLIAYVGFSLVSR